MKFLSNIDLNKNELQNARLQNLATAPASPVSGQVYFNSADSRFYGWDGTGWTDLGQVLTGASIVSLINGTNSLIDDDNLSAAVNDAVGKKHSHTNSAVLNAMEQAFTTALKTKLDGIAANANNYTHPSTHSIDMITESTSKKIMTADERTKLEGIAANANNYVHPGSGTNPHGTTKADLGLGNVENKSSATIRGELTTANINSALGFTPKKILEGVESARPAATGSMIVYIATDTKKIWLDTATNTWLQVGGQDTIDWGSVTGKPTTFPPATHNHDSAYLGITSKAESSKVADSVSWGNVSGKPSTFTPPTATPTVLGGIKVGTNLSIDSNGVLSANDNPTSYIVKQEKFIATAGQTVFNLTKGKYRPGLGTLSIFLNGVKIANTVLEETSQTSFTLKTGLSVGDYLLAEYVELINVTPYPIHGNEHLPGGADPIPEATTSKSGLMSSSDKSKLNGSYTSAQVDAAIQLAVNGLINGAPGALDTLIELANAMGNDPNFAATVTNQLGNKVDKVTGKQLSTEDFTTALLAKLNGIATGAQTNQNAFSNIKVGTTTIAAENATDTLEIVAGTNINITADTTNDKVTINNTYSYTHPSSHPPSIITQDASNRFVTDAEKSTWNSRTKKYSADIGNGSLTTIPVAHNLGSMDVTITIREKASPFGVVFTDIQFVDNNNFNILFSEAPTSGQYRVTVVG